ncbi:MAG: GNAT family N-acetyltransferase [Planctomycetota bacterium]
MTAPVVDVRPVDLTRDPPPDVLRILRELRTHRTEAELASDVRAQAMTVGYRLFGAWSDGVLLGVLGCRRVRTIARGEHLHVDDLVVTASARGRGIGAALLSTIEAAARADGCRSVFLDSRPEVLGFYASSGYAPHTAVLVRKPL